MLAQAFHVLTFEKGRSQDACAGAVLGLSDIYLQMKGFKERMRKPNGQLPTLFFVKVDVTRAFDTIQQDLLMKIVRELVLEVGKTVTDFNPN